MVTHLNCFAPTCLHCTHESTRNANSETPKGNSICLPQANHEYKHLSLYTVVR